MTTGYEHWATRAERRPKQRWVPAVIICNNACENDNHFQEHVIPGHWEKIQ